MSHYVMHRQQQLAGPFDDIWNALKPAAQAVQATAQSEGNVLIEQALRSSQFSKVLDAVKEEAEQAVIDQTKKNAVTLIALAVAGGAIGGAIFKGTAGIVAAGTIAGISGVVLMRGGVK